MSADYAAVTGALAASVETLVLRCWRRVRDSRQMASFLPPGSTIFARTALSRGLIR